MKGDVFPVGLKLEGRRCIVVGGGDEALRRAQDLAAVDALVVVISRAPAESLRQLAKGGAIAVVERDFAPGDLDGAWLAVVAEHDPELVARVAAEAEACRVHHCAVDQPHRGSFSHMARAKAGHLEIAIATGGRAPALARRLKDVFQRLLDDAKAADFVDRIGRLRDRTPSDDRGQVLGNAVKDVDVIGSLELPNEPTDD